MDVFLGQIILATFPFAPNGFAQCNGQSLPVNQNQALYSLLAVNFGGNTTNFNLPDMRGRTPRCMGPSPDGSPAVAFGEKAGVEAVQLDPTQIPSHTHFVSATTNVATTNAGAGLGLAATQSGDAFPLYASIAPPPPPPAAIVPLNSATIASVGGGPGHNNMQPFVVINYCIALTGLYPPRQQ